VTTPAAFPRLSTHHALEVLREVVGMTVEQLEQRASSQLDEATFYPLASSRVTESDLDSVRSLIKGIATDYGYPVRQQPARRREFDQALSERLHVEIPMMKADAADNDVWSFVSLKLCPDVALWRYPSRSEPGADVADGDIDRLLGGVRHVFGRLWWRAEILGGPVSAALLEDEAVGLLERPTIGGYPLLARAVAVRQLALVEELRGEKRQDVFRDAMKRLRRVMGQVSVYVLQSADLDELIDAIFAEAVVAVVGRELPTQPIDGGALAVFERNCGEFWPLVRPLVGEPPWDDMLRLREDAFEYLRGDPHLALAATRIANDLSILITRWTDWSSDERAVIAAAVKYFLLAEDAYPDDEVGGLDDDEAVVQACFDALGELRSAADIQ
jgi:hypothetical protein